MTDERKIEHFEQFAVFNPLGERPPAWATRYVTDDYMRDPELFWAELIPSEVDEAERYRVTIEVRVSPIAE